MLPLPELGHSRESHAVAQGAQAVMAALPQKYQTGKNAMPLTNMHQLNHITPKRDAAYLVRTPASCLPRSGTRPTLPPPLLFSYTRAASSTILPIRPPYLILRLADGVSPRNGRLTAGSRKCVYGIVHPVFSIQTYVISHSRSLGSLLLIFLHLPSPHRVIITVRRLLHTLSVCTTPSVKGPARDCSCALRIPRRISHFGPQTSEPGKSALTLCMHCTNFPMSGFPLSNMAAVAFEASELTIWQCVLSLLLCCGSSQSYPFRMPVCLCALLLPDTVPLKCAIVASLP